MNLEDLKQAGSNNYATRLAALIDAIQLAAQAAQMGPGAMQALAGELHYSTTTVRRLGAMGKLPEDLISVDMTVGAYYTAILYAEEAGLTPVEAIKQALEQGADTPAKVKELLGIEREGQDFQPPLIEAGTEAEVQVWMGGYVGLSIQGFMPSGDIPRMVKLGKVVEVLNPGGYP